MTIPAVLYLRLSSADGPDSESNSIQNQRAFLRQWAADNGFSVTGEYVDDGHTGTDFERPGFQRLQSALLEGAVRCVIVKDLSRLGRNYTETGRYLEQVFPRLGVRFIAVNDQYDSDGNTDAVQQMAVFKNVFNDWYAREASAKVRASLRTLKSQGKFLGSLPPYGYRIDPQDRYHLLPDPQTAPVVRRIFRLFLAGQSLTGIAEQLDREGIPPPSVQKGMTAAGRRFSGQWSARSVRAVLTHPAGRGAMAQQWTRTVNYKVHQRRRTAPEEQIVVENTHEPLVSAADFFQAQRLLESRACRTTGRPHLLTGLVFCADCGAPMYAKKRGNHCYLNCYRYYQAPGTGRCTSHSIREDAVVDAVTSALRTLAAQSVDPRELACGADSRDTAEEQALRERGLERCRRALLNASKDRADGLLTRAEFVELTGALRREEAALTKPLSAPRTQPDPGAAAKRLLRFEQITRPQLHTLVRRIEVDRNGRLTIAFAFRMGQSGVSPGAGGAGQLLLRPEQ